MTITLLVLVAIFLIFCLLATAHITLLGYMCSYKNDYDAAKKQFIRDCTAVPIVFFVVGLFLPSTLSFFYITAFFLMSMNITKEWFNELYVEVNK